MRSLSWPLLLGAKKTVVASYRFLCYECVCAGARALPARVTCLGVGMEWTLPRGQLYAIGCISSQDAIGVCVLRRCWTIVYRVTAATDLDLFIGCMKTIRRRWS